MTPLHSNGARQAHKEKVPSLRIKVWPADPLSRRTVVLGDSLMLAAEGESHDSRLLCALRDCGVVALTAVLARSNSTCNQGC